MSPFFAFPFENCITRKGTVLLHPTMNMTSKVFQRILFALLALGILFTAAHLIYAFYAYQHCSIIYFIAKELW